MNVSSRARYSTGLFVVGSSQNGSPATIRSPRLSIRNDLPNFGGETIMDRPRGRRPSTIHSVSPKSCSISHCAPRASSLSTISVLLLYFVIGIGYAVPACSSVVQ